MTGATAGPGPRLEARTGVGGQGAGPRGAGGRDAGPRGAGPRVVVVGGGVLGISTAAHLVRQGADVTVVTDGPLAGGASGRSLSWLNSWAPRSEPYHRLRLLGIDRYRTLAGQADCAAWLRFDGGLTWAEPGDPSHRAAVDHMRRTGYAAQWLTPEQVAARVPGVDAGAVPEEGAVLNPGEGWVDLPHLVGHLARELVAGGGTVLADAGPAAVVRDARRVTGVRTASGEVLGADAVVLATGAAVPGMVDPLGLRIPDATSTGLLVRTPPVGTRLRAVLNTPRVAVRPAPGGALVLDSGWAEREVVTRPDGTVDVPDATVERLLHEASAVLAGRPTLTAASYGVGPKPVPADDEPVLGPVPGVPGLHVAFTHSGATLGLIAGELLAQEVVEGEPSPLLAGFRADRFG